MKEEPNVEPNQKITEENSKLTMEESEHELGRVFTKDELTMRVKQLSIARGFKLQTAACRGEGKMIFTCTKSGRSYFHKTAKPEDKVFCPFMVMYQQFKAKGSSLLTKNKDFYL